MIDFWIGTSIVLGIGWLCFLGSGIWYFGYNPERLRREEWVEEFRVFSALMAAGLIFVAAFWIILLLAVPLFFIYGVWSGIRLLATKPWRGA